MNVAAYRTEAEAQQFTLVVEHRPGQSTSIVDNLGQTGISGVEVEVEALVAENLTLNLGYAWAKAEIKEYLNTDQADLNGADGSLYDDHRLGSAVGNRIPRIPEHQASLVGRYEGGVMASGFAWFLVGDVVYEGSRYGQIHNLIETGAMTRVGLDRNAEILFGARTCSTTIGSALHRSGGTLGCAHTGLHLAKCPTPAARRAASPYPCPAAARGASTASSEPRESRLSMHRQAGLWYLTAFVSRFPEVGR